MISWRDARTSAIARASIPFLPVRKIFKAESELGERGPPIHIEFFVILLVFAAFGLMNPIHVAAIPLDRVFEAVIEIGDGRPAEFAADPGVVESVAAIVARAILNEFDQAFGLVQQFQQTANDADIRDGAAGADVVNFAELPFLQDGIDGAAMVFNENPVALVEAVAIDGKFLAFEGVGDHQRNQFFRELIGPVIIRRARDDGRKLMRANVTAHEQIRGSLAGSVRTIRRERRILAGRLLGRNAAIDFVGADVDEARNFALAGGFEEDERAFNVGANEFARSGDAAVHVAFCGEMHDGVERLGENIIDGGFVANVAANEAVIRLILDAGEIGEIAGVGEFVEIENGRVGIRGEKETYEIRTDEARAASDEKFHRAIREAYFN